MNLLEVSELTKSYTRGFIPRRAEILKGVSFAVPSGSITGFLGANGSGKTTTMRCLLGLDFADSGSAHFFGRPLDLDGKRKIGFLPEHPYFYQHLTGQEFLEFYANLSSRWKKAVLRDRIAELLDRVDLSFAKDRRLRAYSKGMLQKIGVAQALIHDPELVILDEPMSGLDPDGRLAIAEIILKIAKSGRSVFFSSHLLHDTERLCERLVVLKSGKVIYEGGTQELLDRSGAGFEVRYQIQGEQLSVHAASQTDLQVEIKRRIESGAEILEVRRQRASLEEIFVRMALHGGKSDGGES